MSPARHPLRDTFEYLTIRLLKKKGANPKGKIKALLRQRIVLWVFTYCPGPSKNPSTIDLVGGLSHGQDGWSRFIPNNMTYGSILPGFTPWEHYTVRRALPWALVGLVLAAAGLGMGIALGNEPVSAQAQIVKSTEKTGTARFTISLTMRVRAPDLGQGLSWRAKSTSGPKPSV